MSNNNKRIFLSPPHMGGQELEFVKQAFESNYIAPLGPHVDAFEREFSEIVGIPHAAAVSSGTSAMHLALRLLDVGPGDDVIAPSFTFIGGVSPVVFQGAKLSFIDCEKESWNMDPDLLAEELSFRNKQGRLPKAVISADILGQPADLDRILACCNQYHIPVVSDSAEALGATYKGRHAGKGSGFVVYSFNGNKIITTSGGGMLASDDGHLIKKAKFLSQQARDPAPHYEHTQIGYNYRMSNIVAAIGRGQLRVLDERVEKKRWICDYYRKALADIPGIEFMPEASYGRATRWLTVILITPEDFGSDREAVRQTLEKEDIESRPVWKPMHMQPVFRECYMRGGSVCEDVFNRGLCLPSGTAMTEQDLSRIVGIIRRLSATKQN